MNRPFNRMPLIWFAIIIWGTLLDAKSIGDTSFSLLLEGGVAGTRSSDAFIISTQSRLDSFLLQVYSNNVSLKSIPDFNTDAVIAICYPVFVYSAIDSCYHRISKTVSTLSVNSDTLLVTMTVQESLCPVGYSPVPGWRYMLLLTQMGANAVLSIEQPAVAIKAFNTITTRTTMKKHTMLSRYDLLGRMKQNRNRAKTFKNPGLVREITVDSDGQCIIE